MLSRGSTFTAVSLWASIIKYKVLFSEQLSYSKTTSLLQCLNNKALFQAFYENAAEIDTKNGTHAAGSHQRGQDLSRDSCLRTNPGLISSMGNDRFSGLLMEVTKRRCRLPEDFAQPGSCWADTTFVRGNHATFLIWVTLA